MIFGMYKSALITFTTVKNKYKRRKKIFAWLFHKQNIHFCLWNSTHFLGWVATLVTLILPKPSIHFWPNATQLIIIHPSQAYIIIHQANRQIYLARADNLSDTSPINKFAVLRSFCVPEIFLNPTEEFMVKDPLNPVTFLIYFSNAFWILSVSFWVE